MPAIPGDQWPDNPPGICPCHDSQADHDSDEHKAAAFRGRLAPIQSEGEAVTTTTLIPAGMAPPARPGDSGRDNDGGNPLWRELARVDQSSNERAYAAALIAKQIIDSENLTLKGFAAESAARKIPYFGSQASVSRRLRWADLHDEMWAARILPRGAFISEAASRPLFDGRLSRTRRLELLLELFGPHLSDDDKRKLADELTEARMREHLGRQGSGEGQYKAPRTLDPEKTIARLLAQGMTAAAIGELARSIEDSARNRAAA